MNQPDDTWLEWQREHAAALAALQEAQRAYHRCIVGQSAAEMRQEPLKAVDAARVRLDAVRARRPE